MAIVHITKQNYDAEITNSEQTVLLDFWAPWCIPCRAIGKIVDELDKEQSAIKLAKVDIEDQPEIAAKHGILSIPAIVIFKGGKPVDKLVGVHSKKAILKRIG